MLINLTNASCVKIRILRPIKMLWLALCFMWIIRLRVASNVFIYLFIYLGFYVAFNTVQVISRRVVRRVEETSTYSCSRFFTVNCRPMASNYQLSHLRPCRQLNPSLRGGRRESYHSATVAPASNVSMDEKTGAAEGFFFKGI